MEVSNGTFGSLRKANFASENEAPTIADVGQAVCGTTP